MRNDAFWKRSCKSRFGSILQDLRPGKLICRRFILFSILHSHESCFDYRSPSAARRRPHAEHPPCELIRINKLFEKKRNHFMYQTYHLSHNDALKIVSFIAAELEKP